MFIYHVVKGKGADIFKSIRKENGFNSFSVSLVNCKL